MKESWEAFGAVPSIAIGFHDFLLYTYSGMDFEYNIVQHNAKSNVDYGYLGILSHFTVVMLYQMRWHTPFWVFHTLAKAP